MSVNFFRRRSLSTAVSLRISFLRSDARGDRRRGPGKPRGQKKSKVPQVTPCGCWRKPQPSEKPALIRRETGKAQPGLSRMLRVLEAPKTSKSNKKACDPPALSKLTMSLPNFKHRSLLQREFHLNNVIFLKIFSHLTKFVDSTPLNDPD